jgi:hypothetical protein
MGILHATDNTAIEVRRAQASDLERGHRFDPEIIITYLDESESPTI